MVSKLEKYYNTIPSIYQPKNNRLVNGIIEAWAQEDETIITQLQETKDQLFVYTADNEYLNLLGDSVGVNRPALIALSDVYYRDLIVALSYAPKTIKKTVYDVLDVFWGPTYSRANITSQNTENFNFGSVAGISGQITFENNSAIVNGSGTFFTSELALNNFIRLTSDGNERFVKVNRIVSDTKLYLETAYEGVDATNTAVKITPKLLNVRIDDDTQDTVLILNPKYFNDLLSITSQEIINSINDSSSRITGSLVRTITSQNKNFVNIRTNSVGLNGSIQVTGGTANTILDFPTTKQTVDDLENSTILYEINHREMIIAIPNLVARLYRTLLGATHIHDDIQGTVLNVDNVTKTITVNFSVAVAEDELIGKIFTQGIYEFTIIGNDAGTNNVNIYFGPGDDLSVISDNGGQTFIFSPSLSWSVNHNLNQLRPNITIYDINSEVIVPDTIHSDDANNSTLTFGTPQGGRLAISTQNSTFQQVAPATTWNINHALGEKYLHIMTYDSSNNVIIPDTITAVDANNLQVTFVSSQSGWVAVQEGTVFVEGSATTWSINHNFNSKHVHVMVFDNSDNVIIPDSIVAVDKNNLEINFGIAQAGRAVLIDTGIEGFSNFRILDLNYPNSYIYDLNSSFSVTKRRTFLKQDITLGDKIINLIVDDSSDFPNENGFFVLNLGKSNQEGPIPYKGRLNNGELVLDALYTFKKSHQFNDILNYASDEKAYRPRKNGQDYPFFVTDTQGALVLVQELIERLKAVGVVLRWIVYQPEYKFNC